MAEDDKITIGELLPPVGTHNVVIGDGAIDTINGKTYSHSLFLGVHGKCHIAVTPEAWFINGIEVPVETPEEAREVIKAFRAWLGELLAGEHKKMECGCECGQCPCYTRT